VLAPGLSRVWREIFKPFLLLHLNPMQAYEYIALFGSVTRVMKAEKVLQKEGIPFTLMSSPRMIQSPCGLAIKLGEAEVPDAERTLEDKKLKIMHLYLKKEDGYEQIY